MRSISQKYVVVALCLAVSDILGNAWARAQRPGESAGISAQAIDAVQYLLSTLTTDQRARLMLPLTDQTRVVWSNLPTGTVMQVGATARNGLRFGTLTPQQQDAALALVSTVLSRKGYQKVLAILNADQRLEDETAPTRTSSTRTRFGRAEFFIAVLGQPSPAGRWMIQFGGHHLAINVTVVGRATVLTPSHTGAQPAIYQMDGETIRPLGNELDRGYALLDSFDATQRKQAVLSSQVHPLVLGPGEDGKVIQPEGLKGSAMTARQRAMMADLVGEWVSILNESAAAEKMKDVQSHLVDTYFAWDGPTARGNPAYFRVQGPTVFVEYAPGNTTMPGVDHIHTMYRDPANDYGRRLTP